MTFARVLLTAIAFVPLALTAQGGPPNRRWVLDQSARLVNGGEPTPADSMWDFVNSTRVGAWSRHAPFPAPRR